MSDNILSLRRDLRILLFAFAGIILACALVIKAVDMADDDVNVRKHHKKAPLQNMSHAHKHA